jgi:hypothetical protein
VLSRSDLDDHPAGLIAQAENTRAFGRRLAPGRFFAASVPNTDFPVNALENNVIKLKIQGIKQKKKQKYSRAAMTEELRKAQPERRLYHGS